MWSSKLPCHIYVAWYFISLFNYPVFSINHISIKCHPLYKGDHLAYNVLYVLRGWIWRWRWAFQISYYLPKTVDNKNRDISSVPFMCTGRDFSDNNIRRKKKKKNVLCIRFLWPLSFLSPRLLWDHSIPPSTLDSWSWAPIKSGKILPTHPYRPSSWYPSQGQCRIQHHPPPHSRFLC